MNEHEQQISDMLLRHIAAAPIGQELRDAIHTYRDFLGCVSDRLYLNALISKENSNDSKPA